MCMGHGCLKEHYFRRQMLTIVYSNYTVITTLCIYVYWLVVIDISHGDLFVCKDVNPIGQVIWQTSTEYSHWRWACHAYYTAGSFLLQPCTSRTLHPNYTRRSFSCIPKYWLHAMLKHFTTAHHKEHISMVPCLVLKIYTIFDIDSNIWKVSRNQHWMWSKEMQGCKIINIQTFYIRFKHGPD